MDLCDSEGASCFGVMINAGWTQAFSGVKICLSNVMADKGDWLTRMKKPSEAAEFSHVNSAQWCSEHEDRINICDGDIDNCWKAGMDLCDSEGASCFGALNMKIELTFVTVISIIVGKLEWTYVIVK